MNKRRSQQLCSRKQTTQKEKDPPTFTLPQLCKLPGKGSGQAAPLTQPLAIKLKRVEQRFFLTWTNHAEVPAVDWAKLTARGEAVLEQGWVGGKGLGRQRAGEVVLTCLKQHQHQQQAGSHGQIAPVLLHAGVQAAGTAGGTSPGCRGSGGEGVLNNPPGPLLLRGLYRHGSTPV